MRRFVHCLTGLMESTWHTRLILDLSPPVPTCIVQSWVIFINMCKLGGGLHLLGANFSSAAPRSRGGSVRLRSRQAGGDLGAGARVGWMAVATGTAPARMSNMKRILSMVDGRRQEKRVPHVRMPDDRHTCLPRPLPQLRRPPGLLRRPVGDPKACAAGAVKNKRSRTPDLFLNWKIRS